MQVNQRNQAELNRVKAPEAEPVAPVVDPAQFVDAELAAKAPRERRRREGFSFVQAGKLQRDAEVMRLRVRAHRRALWDVTPRCATAAPPGAQACRLSHAKAAKAPYHDPARYGAASYVAGGNQFGWLRRGHSMTSPA